MTDAVARKGISRAILTLLTLYALAMIVPDFARIVRPLGSFGLATNGDGLIYDVQGPFATEDASPAWRAGLHVGDRLDLAAMRCIPVDTGALRQHSRAMGRRQLRPAGAQGDPETRGQRRSARRARSRSSPEPRPRSAASTSMLALTQLAGVLVVLGAAWLVWTPPGPDDLGLFRLCDLFQSRPGLPVLRPGCSYGRGRSSPRTSSSGVLQAAGYTGPPPVRPARAGGPDRRAAGVSSSAPCPALAILFLAVELASLGSLFGFRTEFAMRAALLIGFAVSVGGDRDPDRPARGSLSARLSADPLGHLGLPHRPAGQLCSRSSGRRPRCSHELVRGRRADGRRRGLFLPDQRRPLPVRRRGGAAPDGGQRLDSAAPRDRPRAPPQPARVLHPRAMNTINEWTDLPEWAWVLVASVLVFLISRLHEWTTELSRPAVRPRLHPQAERHLDEVGRRPSSTRTASPTSSV